MDHAVYQKVSQWFDDHFPEMLEDLKYLCSFPSVAVYNDPDTPYGKDCRNVLHAMLGLAKKYGFETENVDDHCGTATYEAKKKEICSWCHLDVVPAGTNWTLTEPFAPCQVGDYLVCRGADDNKGPAIGVLYGLRAIHELQIPVKCGLRLCFGCDEEHGMTDTEYYVRHHAPAALNIIADCGFPVCYGEKGIIEANLITDALLPSVVSCRIGSASNIIPDEAEIRLMGMEAPLHAVGQSGHSAFPEHSINAIHELTGMVLQQMGLTAEEQSAFRFFHSVNDDYLGTALGINGQDDLSGYTTCVGTMLNRLEDGRLCLHVNIRYCISGQESSLVERMDAACRRNGCHLEVVHASKPNYFPREEPIVDALTSVFNELTGEHREPFVMGGGTYARTLPNALCFGLGGLPRESTALFAPGHGGAHQPDEALYLPNLKKALKIYVMGLLEADRLVAESQAH